MFVCLLKTYHPLQAMFDPPSLRSPTRSYLISPSLEHNRRKCHLEFGTREPSLLWASTCTISSFKRFSMAPIRSCCSGETSRTTSLKSFNHSSQRMHKVLTHSQHLSHLEKICSNGGGRF